MTLLANQSPVSAIAEAQRDMRWGYFGGAPGVAASATVWMIAGFIALLRSPQQAVWALFIGGMFIHPLGLLVARLLGRPAKHTRGNPLGLLALESTILLLLCLPLVYVVSLFRMDWFFPAMLLVIGGRYLGFSTMYGLRVYWVFGSTLALAGYALASIGAPPHVGAFTGAAIEALFAMIIFARSRGETSD